MSRHINSENTNSNQIVLNLSVLKSQVRLGHFEQLNRGGAKAISMFGDFFGFHKWQNGQARALGEFIHDSRINVSYIACANKEVAIRIESCYVESI